MYKKKKRARLGITFLLFVLIIGAILVDSATRLVTEEYELEFSNLPAAFNGYRITQLSDLHCKEYGEDNADLVAAVKETNPQIIVITGDLIEYASQLWYVQKLIPRLVEIAPVYYVTGNHEWANDALPALFTELENLGVKVMRNRYEVITLGNDSIILAGVDDPNGPADQKSPEQLVSEIRAAEGDKFIVLISHRNDLIELYSSLDVDLILAGHAHGGLVRLPFTDGLVDASRKWFPSYTSGVYEVGDNTLLVSRGIGNGKAFLRFLNNPHIPVAILKTK